MYISSWWLPRRLSVHNSRIVSEVYFVPISRFPKTKCAHAHLHKYRTYRIRERDIKIHVIDAFRLALRYVCIALYANVVCAHAVTQSSQSRLVSIKRSTTHICFSKVLLRDLHIQQTSLSWATCMTHRMCDVAGFSMLVDFPYWLKRDRRTDTKIKRWHDPRWLFWLFFHGQRSVPLSVRSCVPSHSLLEISHLSTNLLILVPIELVVCGNTAVSVLHSTLRNTDRSEHQCTCLDRVWCPVGLKNQSLFRFPSIWPRINEIASV